MTAQTPNISLDQALMFEQNGQIQKAAKTYKALEESGDDSVDLCYCYGKFLNKNKKFEQALPLFLKASEKEKGIPLLWYEMAIAYEGVKRFDGAENAFYNAAELARISMPAADSIQLYMSYLSFYVRNNRIDDLRTYLPGLEKIEGADRYANIFRSVVSYFDGNLETCIQLAKPLLLEQEIGAASLLPYIAFALFYTKDIDGLELFFEELLAQPKIYPKAVAKSLLVLREVILFEEGAMKASDIFRELKISNEECFSLQDKMQHAFVRSIIGYFHTLQKLYNIREDGDDAIYKAQTGTPVKPFYMIGDSHTLSSAHMIFKTAPHEAFKITPLVALGIKAWDLADQHTCRPLSAFKMHLEQSVEENSALCISVGEIDCRVDEGFITYFAKNGGNINTHYIQEVVSDYIEDLSNLIQNKNLSFVAVSNVPAPFLLEDKEIHPQLQRLEIIQTFNNQLKKIAQEKSFKLLDIHSLTVGDNGWAKKDVHFDKIHLNPAIYKEAFENLLQEK